MDTVPCLQQIGAFVLARQTKNELCQNSVLETERSVNPPGIPSCNATLPTVRRSKRSRAFPEECGGSPSAFITDIPGEKLALNHHTKGKNEAKWTSAVYSKFDFFFEKWLLDSGTQIFCNKHIPSCWNFCSEELASRRGHISKGLRHNWIFKAFNNFLELTMTKHLHQ